jgi:ethanolamine utilization microcompartment shell protein EutS
MAFVALLTALPAAATTITFSTTGTSSSSDWTYEGVTNLGVTNVTAGQSYNMQSLFDSFGAIQLNTATPGSSSVINVNLTPTVGGVPATTALDFQGTVAVTGSVGTINFGSTPGATAGTGTLAGYTVLQYNNVDYAIQTSQSLTLGAPAKFTWLAGYVMGVPGAITPEPATVATTGMALLFLGFGLRRRMRANS